MPSARKEPRPFAEPGHFYSPIGDPKELRRYFRSAHFARQSQRVDAMLDYDAMAAVWARIAPGTVDFPFEPQPGFRYYGRNNQFEYYDATILSGMIADLDPQRIIEIGAGFSSAAIFDTVDRMAAPRLRRFTTIDPDLSRIRALNPPPMAELIDSGVQSVPVEVFAGLSAGDVLFIDSSHVLKTGSDVHYEYLHILPALQPGVIVHIHDIFYPLDYPKGWSIRENRSWNEVYLVDMLLTHGNSFDIILFNDAFLTARPGQPPPAHRMYDRFRSFDTRPLHSVNGSIWLRRR